MELVDKITSSVISCQIANNQLQEIRGTEYYSHSLKQKLNAIVPELMKRESQMYDKFFEKSEQSTIDVYDVNDRFIKAISKVPIWKMEIIMEMIKAEEKDSKSIEGIVNKILR